MRSYYALTGAIRYYGRLAENVRIVGREVMGRAFDPTGLVYEGDPHSKAFDVGRWKTPPHEAFANLQISPDRLEQVFRFTKHYGYLVGRFEGSLETIRAFSVSLPGMQQRQNVLRKAWEGDADALRDLQGSVESGLDTEFRLRVGTKGFEIAVEDLWTLIRILFLRDHFEGRARVCAASGDPECPSPYFLAVRKGQKFCSDLCAVRENVRRFRERQSAKKNQNSNRGKHAKEKKA